MASIVRCVLSMKDICDMPKRVENMIKFDGDISMIVVFEGKNYVLIIDLNINIKMTKPPVCL